jgi:hypothetical protein
MSSSASTILRQELMAAGENDGTWGPKINTNLQILEAAIADTVSLSISNVDVTLTNSDYTNDQSKKAIIYCTGTLTGAVNIIAPNKSKTFKVVNNTTGSFAVKIKTSSGTGITITQGQCCEVWCDGSDTFRYLSAQTVFGTGAPGSSTGAAASSVSVSASGNLSSTDAQSALVELQLDIDGRQPLDSDLTTIAALTPTKGNVMIGNGSSWVALGVGTNGYVHMADSAQTTGTKWASVMPATTPILVVQTAAPTGYTKVTTHDDKALRVVSGTASSTAVSGKEFSTLFAARTIAALNLPNITLTTTDPGHVHTGAASVSSGNHTAGGVPGVVSTTNTGSATTGVTAAIDSTARGGSQTAMDFAVNYVDTCICTKDA